MMNPRHIRASESDSGAWRRRIWTLQPQDYPFRASSSSQGPHPPHQPLKSIEEKTEERQLLGSMTWRWYIRPQLGRDLASRICSTQADQSHQTTTHQVIKRKKPGSEMG
eukprot:4574494-Amphidinium_carterae.1